MSSIFQGPIARLLLARTQARLDALGLARRQQIREVQRYNFQRAPEKVPLFGVSQPDAPAYGLDWVQTRPVRAPVQGKILPGNKPIVNRSGSTVNLEPLENSQRPYEDPNTSRSFKRSSEGTDQVPIHGRHSAGVVSTPVFEHQAKRSFETARPKEKTAADQHREELKREPFSFFA